MTYVDRVAHSVRAARCYVEATPRIGLPRNLLAPVAAWRGVAIRDLTFGDLVDYLDQLALLDELLLGPTPTEEEK